MITPARASVIDRLFCNTQLKLSIFIIVVRGITGIKPEDLIPLLFVNVPSSLVNVLVYIYIYVYYIYIIFIRILLYVYIYLYNKCFLSEEEG